MRLRFRSLAEAALYASAVVSAASGVDADPERENAASAAAAAPRLGGALRARAAALLGGSARGRKLPACSAYPTSCSGTTTITIAWLGSGGADAEWLNVDNWASSCLPGTAKYNKLVMAANDHGTVHCPATYMVHNVELEMRSGATLDVNADLNIGGNQLMIKTDAKLTQSGQSAVTVGGRLYLAAGYELSDDAQLSIGTYAYVPLNGLLTLNGAGTAVTASTSSEFHGALTYNLGPNGAGLFEVNAPLIVGAGARLVVDAGGYDFASSAAAVSIPLVKFGSGSTGSFAAGNVDVSGVPGGWTWSIEHRVDDGVSLHLTLDGAPPPPPPPPPPTSTPAPVASPTPMPVPDPTPVPTLPPTSVPTPEPTLECTSSVDCDDDNACTLDACLGGGTCDNAGNACAAGEVCVDMQCVPTTPTPAPAPAPTAAPAHWPGATPPGPTGAPTTPSPVDDAAPVPSPPTPPPAPPSTDDFVAAIPDSAGYRLIYALDDIPSAPDFTDGVPYSYVDPDLANIPPFTSGARVAYFVESDGLTYGHRWAWVSVDAFIDAAECTGVPCPSCGQGTIQQSLTEVNVASNIPGYGNGTGLEGNIEFWPVNYGFGNGANVPRASDDKGDSGDTPASSGNYGSMQIHVDNPSDLSSPRETIFALNKFNKGVTADFGIGTNPDPNGHPDWTFSATASSYTTKKLRVYVKEGAPTPPTPVTPPTPAPVPPPVPTTVVTLGASGVNNVMPEQDCPGQVTDELHIDGSGYTAGPGTLTLYACSTGVGFDPMRIRLTGFPSGLRFEIVSSGSNVNLVIKSLSDYSEYFRGALYSPQEYPYQSSQTHFPEFSWDTIPRWMSFRKNSDYTQDEINSIADNNYASWYGLMSQDEIIGTAQRIKARNPNYKMILYHNSYGYWGTPIPSFNEDWLKYSLDGNGNRVYELDKSGNRRLFNHTKPEMRQWWIDHALMMMSDPSIDGVFADATRSPPDTYHSQMIAELAQVMPPNLIKMGNFLRNADTDGNRWRMHYEEGSYMENVHVGPINQPSGQALVVSMQLAREALSKGKMIWWNGSPLNCDPADCTITPEDMSEYIKPTLAEYLIVAEKYAYYNFNVSPNADLERWKWDTSGMEEFGKFLGQPLGPPVKVGDKFSRHFEGVSVVLDVMAHTGTYEWA